jgi:hypothetical protein
MIINEARRKFAEEFGGLTRRFVEAFDEADREKGQDPTQAILDEALSILKERIDAISEP